MKGIKTTAMIDYAIKYVKMLLGQNMTVIMVFDGRNLPAKAGTEAKRRSDRELAKKKANDFTRAGKLQEAKKEFDRAVDITHEHALQLMEECRKINVECINAMYEADAQLAYLNKIGLAEYVISEDSDLILFGCKKIVFKLTLDGKCLIFDSSKLHLTIDVPAEKFSFEKFRRICILSGCDYLDSLYGVGLGKATKFMLMTEETDMTKALPKIVSYLNLKKAFVTNEYIDAFLKAEATFKYMYVYDPRRREMVRLNELEDENEESHCVNAGDFLDNNTAYQLALGNLNPKSLNKVCNYDPSKATPSNKVNNLKNKPHSSIWQNNILQMVQKQKQQQQSTIKFHPFMKIHKPEIQEIINQENKVEEDFEMTSLLSQYAVTEIKSATTSTANNLKRKSPDLANDKKTSSKISSFNPFSKRQHVETEKEKAENLSLLKSINDKDNKIFSKYFIKQRPEEPLEKRLEHYKKNKEEQEKKLQGVLNKNLEFYKFTKIKPPSSEEEAPQESQEQDKNLIIDSNSDEQLKEIDEVVSPSMKSLDITDEEDILDGLFSCGQPFSIELSDEEEKQVFIPKKRTAISQSKLSLKRKKSTSISESSQSKLHKFGFTKTNVM